MSASDPDEIAKQAREHAWNWFALHATQRMQALNFFFVATAFLLAAYGSLLEKHPSAAAIIGAVGAWLTFCFNRLDVRNRQLVEDGEKALKVSQEHLADLSQNQHLNSRWCGAGWLDVLCPHSQHDAVANYRGVSLGRCLCVVQVAALDGVKPRPRYSTL
jgi:hypothetical protein